MDLWAHVSEWDFYSLLGFMVKSEFCDSIWVCFVSLFGRLACFLIRVVDVQLFLDVLELIAYRINAFTCEDCLECKIC